MSKDDLSLEKKFELLCGITRAAHFEWRQAALDMNPSLDPVELVCHYWKIVGQDTAKAYHKMIDASKPIPQQVAELLSKSSLAMGEKADAKPGDKGSEYLLVHNECPWPKWHERYNALAEDQPGCDKWFMTIAEGLSESLGINLKIETVETIAEGAKTCTRRIWVEE